MKVNTGGPIRGFVSRWLMRFEVSRQIMSIGFQGTTAVSALSGVLSYAGYERYVLPVLTVWALLFLAIAYIIADGGILNRKNREKADYGSNFAGPTMRIDDEMIARSVMAGMRGRELTDEERQAIKSEADETFAEYRNGVSINGD